MRALLLQVPVDDLADSYGVPAIGEDELRRIREQARCVGLRRHPGRSCVVLVVAARIHPAKTARFADTADQNIEEKDGAVVEIAVDVSGAASVAKSGGAGRGGGELSRDAGDVLGGDGTVRRCVAERDADSREPMKSSIGAGVVAPKASGRCYAAVA